VDELLALWEDWGRETNANRLALRERETGLARLAGIEERHVERLDQLGRGLGRLRNACYDDNARLEDVAERIDRGVRAMRMLPLATILNLFPRMVRDISREQGKDVELVVEGGEIEADKHILEKIKDPLMHLVRNAVDHGIESPEARERDGKSRLGTIWLKCRQGPTHIVIEVQDDGGGLDAEAIKRVAAKRKLCREEELAAMTLQQVHGLVFVSGFSTRPFVTDISGRGVGLDVVRANVEELKGKVEVESSPSSGSLFRLRLPVTLATSRILLAAVGGRTYGLPVDAVQTSLRVDRGALFTVEGRSTLVLQEEAVSVAPLAELLELPPGSPAERPVCVVLGSGADRLGVLVDDVVGEQEVVVKPAGALLKRVRNVSGAAILGSGEICIILSAPDLIRSVRKRGRALPREEGAPEAQRKPVVLLVEDSITTRTQEKRILESAGYEVVAAVDGVEAWEKLGSQSFDAVVSDIEMPHLDGFALTEKIRQEKRHLDLPVILVSTLAGAEDKRKGMEAGANAFLVKSAFDQTVLIETLKRLI
jgi:two-component system chemotaxis sensor kinase CheA